MNNTEYVTYFVYYEDGSSVEVSYPSDWTKEEVVKQEGTDDIMGPYPIKED